MPPDAEVTLRNALAAWPGLADRITRQLLIVLHSEGLASIDAVYDEARAAAGEAASAPPDDNPNRPGAAPWSALEREAVREAVVRHASARLDPERVQAVIDGVRRREEPTAWRASRAFPTSRSTCSPRACAGSAGSRAATSDSLPLRRHSFALP
jgi:hypothetical protein